MCVYTAISKNDILVIIIIIIIIIKLINFYFNSSVATNTNIPNRSNGIFGNKGLRGVDE